MTEASTHRRSKALDTVLPVFIAAYIMLYEWRIIFELESVSVWAYVLKCIIPGAMLFALIGLGPGTGSRSSVRYLGFFALFMAWGLFSSLYSTVRSESFTQWAKFMPLLVFYWAGHKLFLGNDRLTESIKKILVFIAVLSVVQYIGLKIGFFTGVAQGFPLPTHRGGVLDGPGGRLGQGLGMVQITFRDIGIFRLRGFWLEPATAAGFLLAAAFFAEGLYESKKAKIWRVASVLCFLGGGVATFSNSGYLAIGAAGALGEIFWLRKGRGRAPHLVKLCLFLLICFLAVFGRHFAVKYFPKNNDIGYVIGVRENIGHPYGGRLERLRADVRNVLFGTDPAAHLEGTFKPTALTGIGFRIPGKDEHGRGVLVSASAPVLWFVFTGLVGLGILLLRESQVFSASLRAYSGSKDGLRSVQAWLVVFITHLSYGSFMTPLYLTLVMILFAADNRQLKWDGSAS